MFVFRDIQRYLRWTLLFHEGFHSLFAIYTNFTMQGWNNEIKEKVNGEETCLQNMFSIKGINMFRRS